MAQNLKINITAQDKTKQAFNGIRGGLASLKNAVFSLKGAFIGLGAGLVTKSFISTGRSIEDLQVRLKQLFGSTQEGAKAFDVMANFASKVPFSLEQIQEASGNLAVVAGDADRLAKILEITGNVASVTGIDFRTAGEQIQRSFAGGIASADIFREKGVRDMLGFKAGATVTAEETVRAFERVFGKDGKFGKATDELANTFTGTLSMLGDKLFNFKRGVAGAGFFDELKKEFKALNEFIEQNTADFEAIGKVISKVLTFAVKAFAGAIRAVGNATGFIRRQIEQIQRLLGFEVPFVIEIEKGKKVIKEVNLELVKEKSLFEKIVGEVKKLNQSFKIEKEIVGQIRSGVQGVSKSIAESIVLGKELNVTFKQLAQQILVNIISKTIERIALLGIEKILLGDINKQEAEKDNLIRKQNTNLKRQIMLNALTGGSGGGFFGGFFAQGGAVSKGKPIVVGEQGAELFVPNSSGQITQNARGTGGGATTVNFNINTVDASGFEELLVRSRGTITQLINNAVNERGSKNLI
ncbi:tape measure protein [uncultured Mediterranean phage uvMED]|nr:tape measure protein [uncultured Mediterranean phage uvMED]BAQ91246.1 tape measure protein [uncultured Mediterranean phage uvMED]BAR20043.1 tape measure protein [uncultured Mediterranean phage uvMED]